jgi:hypothetical protein
MSKAAIYFTRFKPTIERGGGSRRLMQMLEAFKSFNTGVVSTARADRLSGKAIKEVISDVEKTIDEDGLLGIEYKMWSRDCREYVCRLRGFAGKWVQSVTELPEQDIVFLDDPIYFTPLLAELKRCRVPTVALCQNLEALASGQVESDSTLLLLNQEIDVLSQCDLLITISREETFLLNNLGINSLFFPYYPVKRILNRLLQVREKRKDTKKQGILLLGNTNNLPTRQGMERMMAFWQSNALFREQGKLIVAGFGTGKHFSSHFSKDAAAFPGEISDKELDRRLCTVRACLCYQESGAGALTRICEMLIAGIPVVANSSAARSYYNMDGVIEFRGLSELEKVLKQVDRFDGRIPIPSAPDTAYLVSEVKKIMKK